MPERLPDGITREHLLAAIDDLESQCFPYFRRSGRLFNKKLYDNCTTGRLVYTFWHFLPFVESVSYRI